ncbi:hypothetical protein L3Y34_013382 [Caenorhabditis briggsae]|nr:hypothetical protein L3Y34_013382 [Caenorhabditis briggsae]
MRVARKADGYDTKCGEQGVQLSGDEATSTSNRRRWFNKLRDVDTIAVIYEGYVAKAGNHKKLMKDTDGMYYKLIRRQRNLMDENFEKNFLIENYFIY